MFVIGITGAIASGKSFVAQQLGDLGAVVLDADRIGHAVLRLPKVKEALHTRWGGSVFRAAVGSEQGDDRLGAIDRSAVARRVFAPAPDGPRELAYLESVTHPLIEARISRCLERWRHGGRLAAVVLDAPVLYKAGWDEYCDKILFVEAPDTVRAARAAQRGWSREQLQSRQKRQPSIAWQRERADVVIDNGGAPDATARQLAAFWATLQRES